MTAELKQTKNHFKTIGKVTRIDKDGAFKEDTMTKGAKEGELYRSLKFGVKTSDTNEITVSMFDFEPKEVFMWNSDKKKEDPSYKGDRFPFATWEEQQEDLREQGYSVLQSRVGLTYGEDGKLESKGLPSFVSSELIYNELDNGDSVVVEGTIRYSTYENRQGKEIEQKTYTITKLFKIKDVDFSHEEFEEVTYFEQEMVFVGIDVSKEEKKAYVTGRHINYNKSFHDIQMIIDFNDGNDGTDEEMKKLANEFAKRLTFGDLITIHGDTLNRAIVAEVEEDEDDEEDLFKDFGGKKKPKHAQGFVTRTYVTEMQIHGIDAWDEAVYTEEDFVKDDLIEDGKPNLSDEFGGKKKKEKANPFKLDDDDSDIDDDDLPF
jgi:single-stranded DNA-binding protein